MNPTEVLGEAWGLYRRHWKHLLPVALVVYLLLSLLTLLLVWLLGPFGAIIGAVVSLAGIFWLQGALVVAIEDVRDGRADLSIGETLSQVRPRLNTLAVAGILAALGVALGLVLLIVPGLVLLTWWLFIVPVIMLEGAGVTQSFGRSRQLVRGNGWNVFGLLVMTIVILIVVGIILSLVMYALPEEVRSYLGNVISNTLTAPFVAAAWTLGYYKLRGAETATATAAEVPPATT